MLLFSSYESFFLPMWSIWNQRVSPGQKALLRVIMIECRILLYIERQFRYQKCKRNRILCRRQKESQSYCPTICVHCFVNPNWHLNGPAICGKNLAALFLTRDLYFFQTRVRCFVQPALLLLLQQVWVWRWGCFRRREGPDVERPTRQRHGWTRGRTHGHGPGKRPPPVKARGWDVRQGSRWPGGTNGHSDTRCEHRPNLNKNSLIWNLISSEGVFEKLRMAMPSSALWTTEIEGAVDCLVS